MDLQSQNELVAVHLRYTSGARPLRTRAIAQLVAKVLYTLPHGKGAPVELVTTEVAAMAGVANVQAKDVADGFGLLKAIGLVEIRKGWWQLSEKGKKEIDADLARFRTNAESIFERHFPQAIPREQLRKWFDATCVEYFGRYGTSWAASVCRAQSNNLVAPGSLKEIVQGVAEKYGLGQYTDALAGGFIDFVESNDRKDQDHLWSLGQAMFAARLIAAGVGADPITTKELKDSRVFLDTNILLIASLEGHKYAHSLAALGKALRTLNIRPVRSFLGLVCRRSHGSFGRCGVRQQSVLGERRLFGSRRCPRGCAFCAGSGRCVGQGG